MKLGRRSQSMPWIFRSGIISTWGWGGELGVGKGRHKSVGLKAPQLYLSSHSLYPPTLSNLPSSTPSSPPPLCYSFAFSSFVSVVCLPLGTKLWVCSIMYVCVCLKALWNDTLIHSVLYFLIWLTITVRVNRRCISLPLSLFLWVSCCWMEVFTRSVVLLL